MNERRPHTGLYSRLHNVKRRCAGEALIEQLCSLLVAALAVLILSGAVASGARVDARTRNISQRGEPEFIPPSFSPTILSLRLTRFDGASIVSSVSLGFEMVNGQKLYHYETP